MRSQLVTDIDNTLEKTTWYLHPDRYRELFITDQMMQQEALTLAGRPVEEVVEDLDEYDRYFAGLEEKRTLTGGEVLAMADDEGWV